MIMLASIFRSAAASVRLATALGPRGLIACDAKCTAWKHAAKCLATGALVLAAIGSPGCGSDRSEQGSEITKAPQSAPIPTFQDLALQAQQQGSDRLETSIPVTDRDLLVLAQTPTVDTLICDAGELSDVAVESIASLPNLRHLRLRHSPISDDGFQALAAIKTLWFLNLPHSRCTAKGIASLAVLPDLRNLRLGSDLLGADAAGSLSLLHSLRSVHLIGVPFNDEGLRLIAALPELESIYLDDSSVTEDGWQWLFENYPDLHVHVDQQHHDRDPHRH